MLHVDLTQLAGGTLQEKFDREITRVVENMQDPNTPFNHDQSFFPSKRIKGRRKDRNFREVKTCRGYIRKN